MEWEEVGFDVMTGRVIGEETKRVTLDSQETREAVKEYLKKGRFSITFDKVNGERRNMLCTRSGTLISRAGYVKKEVNLDDKPFAEDDQKAREEKVLSVFDLEKNAWRSMRWELIREIREVA